MIYCKTMKKILHHMVSLCRN